MSDEHPIARTPAGNEGFADHPASIVDDAIAAEKAATFTKTKAPVVGSPYVDQLRKNLGNGLNPALPKTLTYGGDE